MAKSKNGRIVESKKTHIKKAALSPKLAAKGIKTAEQFANTMAALMTDVLTGAVTPSVANAAVNAGGKLLQVVEMEFKYGARRRNNGASLNLLNNAQT